MLLIEIPPTWEHVDTSYFSAANVMACEAQDIVPMLAVKRDSHHIPVLQRFAADAPAPQTDDSVVKMAHRQATKAARALYGLRKQAVEPMFGIIKRVMGWSQMSMRELDNARGEWSLVSMAWNIKRLYMLRAAQKARPVPPKTIKTQPCNASWAPRELIRSLAAAKTASQHRRDGPAVSYADRRGSSPTAP